jgi:hypothetical protein
MKKKIVFVAIVGILTAIVVYLDKKNMLPYRLPIAPSQKK